MSEERMVPFSQAARMLQTGFEWEAGLFVEVYQELCERLSPEEARDILGKSMYRAGLRLGREARDMVDGGGPIGMAKAWDVIYGMGTQEAEDLGDKIFRIRAQGCAAFDLLKRAGLSGEELHFVGAAYCAGDAGHARGFDGEMYFQHTSRLLNGDPFCEWYFTDEEQDPASSRVPEEDFKD